MFRIKSFALLKGFLPCIFFVVVFAGCASAPTAPSQTQPEWVKGGVHARFNSVAYLSEMGRGNSRHAAERDALGRLVAIFGQSIHVDERMTELYWEVMGSGVAATWGERIDIEHYFERRADMDDLVGAEIGDFWEDDGGTIFALAVLNRARAVQIYSGRIRANQETINNLTNMPLSERNTFDGFARYQLAAILADMNFSYGEILTVIGAPQYARGLQHGGNFRRDAQEIRRTIPIGINVRNDRGGRIHDAFARVFSELGFMTTSNGSDVRYLLDVDISMRSGSNFSQFLGRYITLAHKTLRADLRDTRTEAVFLPFSFTESDSSTLNQRDAENRALLLVEQRINNEYRNLLSDHLSRLMPGR